MILANKITAAFIIWMTACLAIAVFAISPAFANLFLVESGIKKQDGQIASNANRAAQIRYFKEFSRDEGLGLSKINGLFVNAQSPLDTIDFLENTAKNAGVKMEISSSSEVQDSEKDAWPSFYFQVTLTGEFSSILKFVKNVESGRYLISVPSFSILSGQNLSVSQASPNILSASVMIMAYVNDAKK